MLAPGAATALAKVTGVIVTARVRLRAAQDEAPPPPLGPRRGIFQGCLLYRGQKRPVFEFHVRKLYREGGEACDAPAGISAQGVVIGIGARVVLEDVFKEDRSNF